MVILRVLLSAFGLDSAVGAPRPCVMNLVHFVWTGLRVRDIEQFGGQLRRSYETVQQFRRSEPTIDAIDLFVIGRCSGSRGKPMVCVCV